MAKRRRHQADQKADLRGGKFIGLPVVVFTSDAWRLGLSSFDRDVHMQILAAFNGYNNAKLVISQRQIAERIGSRNFHKIGRSVARQIEVGLLAISAESVWKERRAREYRLTYCSTSAAPFIIPATNEYLAWRKNDAEDASAETTSSAERASARSQKAAERASARFPRKPQICVEGVNSSAEGASSLISKPYQGAAQTGQTEAPGHPQNPGGQFRGEIRARLIDRLAEAEPGTQTALANRLGIPGGSLSRFLAGKGLADRHVAALARELATVIDGGRDAA